VRYERSRSLPLAPGQRVIAPVANNESVEAPGIGSEDVRVGSREEIAGMICGHPEKAWIFTSRGRPLTLAMIFSANSTIHEDLYPARKRNLDSNEVELTRFTHSGQFGNTLLVDLSSEFSDGHRFEIACLMRAILGKTRANLGKHSEFLNENLNSRPSRA
jgi:4'-phosphopantetheinyl transferase EntD